MGKQIGGKTGLGMNDLYFEFSDGERPVFCQGEATVISNVVLVGGDGSRASLVAEIASKREFPNSVDFFGVALYNGMRYSMQASLNEHLHEGDGIVLTPLSDD